MRKMRKKWMAIMMLMVFIIQSFLGTLIVNAEENSSSSSTQGIVSDKNIASSKEALNIVIDHLRYNKQVHKEIVKRILMDEVFKSNSYKKIYLGGDSALQSYQIGNYLLYSAIGEQMDKESGKNKNDQKGTPKAPYGMIWTPLYLMDGSKLVTVKSPEGKEVPQPLQVKYLAPYDKVGVLLNISINPIKTYETKYNVVEANKTQQMIGKSEDGIKTVDKALANYTLFYNVNGVGEKAVVDIGSPVKFASREYTKNIKNWNYAATMGSLHEFRRKFSVKTDDEMKNQIVGIDSYGNIITHNLDVVVPFWQNDVVEEFRSLFKDHKRFLSHPILKYGVQTKAAEIVPALVSKENNFYELEDKNLKGYFIGKGKFVTSYKKNSEKKVESGYSDYLKELYQDPEFIDKVADLIVAKTESQVKAFNERYIRYLEESKEAEGYLTTSAAGYAFLTGGIKTKEDAEKYIYSADGVLQRIGRILDVGVFELIRLTVASWISDFYNSNVINFSVGEIFHTKLLSQSYIWHKVTNTILVVVVSFMCVYLLLLLIRLFMGYITIKGILIRFLILVIATASPMILYSPLVDIAFNKPAVWVMGKEMNRMFMLDDWRNKWEQFQDENADELAAFLPEGNLRERAEEYTIPFFTSRHIEGYDLNTADGMRAVMGKPNPNQVVVVNVSAFHVMDWLNYVRKNDVDISLFDYLAENYDNEYDGIQEYEEFSYDTSITFGGGLGNYKGERITASQLLKKIYDNIMDKNPYFNDVLYGITDQLFYGSYKNKGNAVADQVLFDLASTVNARGTLYGKAGEVSATTKSIVKKLPSVALPKSDLLGLENIMKTLRPFRLNGNEDFNSEVYQVNRNVIDTYINDYLSLRRNIQATGDYSDAEREVLILNAFFEINKLYDIPLFPKSLEKSSITLDTYVRALFIPLTEFTPYAKYLDNVANYIAINSDLFATMLFGLMLITLFLYGLVKFIVLFVLLMPLIMASFFYNYVWLENTRSKAWVGALGILGSFALVNGGLLLLWKGLIYAMNVAATNSNKVGVLIYPVTFAHSAIVILYLILAFYFVFKPLYRTVKADLRNLGGTKMADGLLNMTGKVKGSLNAFWNNLTDAESRKGKLMNALEGTKLGTMVSAVKAAKDAFTGTKNLDTSMASKLDVNQLKANRTEAEAARDKVEVDKVTQKLEQAQQQQGKSVGGSTGVNGAEEVGQNVLVRVLGLFGVREALKDKSGKDRSLLERLIDAKEVAGRTWLSLEKAREALALNEQINNIANLPEDKIEMTEDDWKAIEEMGLDKEIREVKDFTNISPLMLDVSDFGIGADIISKALKGNYRLVTANGKVVMDMAKEELNDPAKRKKLLLPVLDEIEKTIGVLSNSKFEKADIGNAMVFNKVADRVYEFKKNEMTDHLLKYIDKKKEEGLGVVVQNLPDGKIALHFADENEAKKFIDDLEQKSMSLAKLMGITSTSSFDVPQEVVTKVKKLLDELGVEADLVDVGDGLTNIRISEPRDLEKVREALMNSEELRNYVKEITGGVEKVVNNALAVSIVKDYVEKGVLALGEDVVVRDGNVYAVTDQAKRVLREIEHQYGDYVTKAVDDLRDFAMKVGHTIVGDEQGIPVDTYVRGTDFGVEYQLKESDLGKERYILNNRSFNVDDFSKLVNSLEAKRTKLDKEIRTMESELRIKEHDLLKRKEEIQMMLKNDLERYQNEMKQRLQSIESELLSRKQLENLSDEQFNMMYREAMLNVEREFEEQKNRLIREFDQQNGNVISQFEKEIAELDTKLKERMASRERAFNELERELLEKVNKARAVGMDWRRLNENQVEFASEVKGNEGLVRELMDQYEKVLETRVKRMAQEQGSPMREGMNRGDAIPRRERQS